MPTVETWNPGGPPGVGSTPPRYPGAGPGPPLPIPLSLEKGAMLRESLGFHNQRTEAPRRDSLCRGVRASWSSSWSQGWIKSKMLCPMSSSCRWGRGEAGGVWEEEHSDPSPPPRPHALPLPHEAGLVFQALHSAPRSLAPLLPHSLTEHPLLQALLFAKPSSRR